VHDVTPNTAQKLICERSEEKWVSEHTQQWQDEQRAKDADQKKEENRERYRQAAANDREANSAPS
jgi:hypothetical protein